MTRYSRIKAKRKITQAIGNMEVAQNHLRDFLAMGYQDRQEFLDPVMVSVMGLDELVKLLTRLEEKI